MFHRFAEFIWQAFHEERVCFKDAEKISGTGLTLSKDGEGVGVVAEGYA